MKPVLLFGAAALLVFLVGASLSIYAFGQYERAWGQGGSLWVEAWLGLVAALVAMGSFGISSAFLRRAHSPLAAWVLGAACAFVFVAVCWLIDDFVATAGVYATFGLLVAIPVLASFAGLRHAG